MKKLQTTLFTFFQKKINLKIQLRCKSLRLLNVYNSSFPTLYPKLQLKTSTHNPLFCKASPPIIIHLKVPHPHISVAWPLPKKKKKKLALLLATQGLQKNCEKLH
ncbi:uncharacterized protein [Malus domestica]|uniref:uncharacterized protein isoform X2 n=1 Tax=Malus domestica TaxID=3750 RepID=UPI0039760CD2